MEIIKASKVLNGRTFIHSTGHINGKPCVQSHNCGNDPSQSLKRRSPCLKFLLPLHHQMFKKCQKLQMLLFIHIFSVITWEVL